MKKYVEINIKEKIMPRIKIYDSFNNLKNKF